MFAKDIETPFRRMVRGKERSGKKSCGSADVSTGMGASPPLCFAGADEQHSLASDDSLGPVANMFLIPRMPSMVYEVSSSLGYTCAKGSFSYDRNSTIHPHFASHSL